MVGMLITNITLCLASCSFWVEEITEEQKIRETIFQVEEGIETESLSKAMSVISDRYKDPQGLSKKALQALLFQRFRKHGPLHLQFSPMVIEVEGELAQAEFEVVILEREKEAVVGLPVGSEQLHFKVSLIKDEQDWKIVAHSREPVWEE